jgi:hypothetical protein
MSGVWIRAPFQIAGHALGVCRATLRRFSRRFYNDGFCATGIRMKNLNWKMIGLGIIVESVFAMFLVLLVIAIFALTQFLQGATLAGWDKKMEVPPNF